MSKISYSAVVLNNESRNILIDLFKKVIPDNYEIICHHMTINMGELDYNMKKYLGNNIDLIVNSIAYDDKVIAVGVEGFYSKNKIPHITLAVNRKNGGKPFMSNKLTDWKRIKKVELQGIVQEIPF